MSSGTQARSAGPAGRSGGALVEGLVDRLEARLPPERGALVANFARAYVRRASAARFDALDADELVAHVLGVFDFVDQRRPGQPAVRVFDPDRGHDGWEAAGTVVEVNLEDAPFLVDTVREELGRHGYAVRLMMHPVCDIGRGSDGRIVSLSPARGGGRPESIMHVELDRHVPAEATDALRADLLRVLGDARRAVGDFETMVERLERMIDAARAAGARYAQDEVDETVAFLRWLREDNFVFLGYREYTFRAHDGDCLIEVVPGSGLGILADAHKSAFSKPVAASSMAEPLRERVLGGPLLVISKTNREATVHRRSKMDYIGVKRVDGDGDLTGELRLLGLFSTKVEREQAASIPILRRKLREIVGREGLFPGSHDFKAVVSLFESYPKDELFQASADELRGQLMALLELQERRQVRLFVRRSRDGRSISALVAVPRDHVSADLRARLGRLLQRRFGGTSVDDHLVLGETEPARLHYTVHLPPDAPADIPVEAVERELLEAARTWHDRFEAELAGRLDPARARELADRYGVLFPDYYTSASTPAVAAEDVLRFERLGPDRRYELSLSNERGVAEPLTRLKLFKTGGKTALTDFLPILEDLGLKVVEEVPTRFQQPDGEGFYLHDIGVLGPGDQPLDITAVGDAVVEAVRAVWDGFAESDSLNRLVVTVGLRWRQVAILRAYRQYRQVLGFGFTTRYQNDAFVRNGGVASKLVELFEARFDPALADAREERSARLERELEDELRAIESLDDDRILRAFLGMMRATVRTNAFVAGGSAPHLSLKLRSAGVPGMPRPVPKWEIFVHSARMEGVHLRGGDVARGGIRWSDRLEDYRTEILGLMKAQMVKNAVIVPVGAKGGFILKRPPAGGDRDALMAEERDQYVTLMRGMLDVTDNIVGGAIVHPEDVVVHDDEDAYLVVAADKGTAHLSDTANAVSAEYGFWLGDAYASGGSSGYDHKALGITAKGAWESVKRHFREIGRDVMREPFTAVGVGDMSGDVFGNGMLLSRKTLLVAAFDHRHVFLDPSPDPEASFLERERLFRLPRSSWADYDRSLISAGGGVWPRGAKSIQLAPEAQRALGVERDEVSPEELVRAVLCAPVDLLWNGGVGTFVKASDEANVDVGDRSNDAVRVNAGDLRALVVGEGGNLGFTQLGRIEYARDGGKINTDAIDNSAGVDCSDHEVNLKILLKTAMDAGGLELGERDRLLAEVVDDVVAHVLYDNYLQVQILSQESVAPPRMEAYEDLMEELESAELLDRSLEFLPSADAMAEQGRAGGGLTRPQLCVLLAYAKRLLRSQLLASTLPDDPYLMRYVAGYFPDRVIERFGGFLGEHPLRRELAATIATNDIVNAMGITFVTRMHAETGAAPEDVARAFLVARDVSDARARWGDVEALDDVVEGKVQARLMDAVDSLVEQLVRWYLNHVRHPDLAAEVERASGAFRELARVLDADGTEAWRDARTARLGPLLEAGVPEPVARAATTTPELVYAPDMIVVAQATGHGLEDVVHAFFRVGERLYLDAIEARVAALEGRTRWQRLAWQTMIDDLRLLRREIALRVLQEHPDVPVDEAVERYLAARVDPRERLEALVRSPAGGEGIDDPSAIMVVIHQIRQVVGS